MATHDDDKPNDPNDLPYRGAFPGYAFGKGLFMAWTTALQQQADIFNEGWGKLLAGNFEMKDWYRAVAKSIEASAAGLQQLTLTLGLPGSPPWASIPSATAVPIRTKQLVDESQRVSATRLTRLGGGDYTPPELDVHRKGDYAIEVSWQYDERQTAGQYIGFALSDRYSEPLAIVTVMVR